jgi:putative transposase
LSSEAFSFSTFSDAGCQYTSFRYSDRLLEAGIAASIGSVGDSYDNAMAEALNGTFKSCTRQAPRPEADRAQLELAIIRWVDWYNRTGFTARSDIPRPSTRPVGTVSTTP